MPRFVLFFLAGILLLAVACNSDQSNQKLISRIDSLTTRITQPEEQQNSTVKTPDNDTIQISAANTDTMKPKKTTITEPVTPKKEKPQPKEKKETTPAPVETITTTKDTIYHYYTNSKKVSVKITPWHEEKRNIILYDPWGKETYSIEDVRHSYSSVSEIKSFHPNGAVDRIETHLNPGASMYWYESSTTFGINNEPLWQTSQRFPARLEDYNNNASYWDKKCSCWKKQEAFPDQPPMRD